MSPSSSPKRDWKSFNMLRFGTGAWDPSHRFETSWLFSPWMLFGCRAAIALYCFTTTFFILGWQCAGHDGLSCHDSNKSFAYFTVLCYWGLSFYFLASSIHTFTYAHHGVSTLTRLPRPLQALHHLLHTTITTCPFLVTIVFWGVLYSTPFSTRFGLWSNVSQHGLNSFFALFELLIPRISPAPMIHLLWLLIILALYCALAYLNYDVKHYYTYNFLNPQPEVKDAEGKKISGGVGHAAVVGYVFGIMAAVIVIFLVVKGVAWVKTWVTERRQGRGESDVEGDVQLMEISAEK